MTLKRVQPPSIAVWLISLLVTGEPGESILGDLIEEFAVVTVESGTPSARNWFWRQTVTTLPRLAGFALRSAPWMIVTAVVGGFLLRKLIGPLVGSATFAVIERYQVFFDRHFSAYLFLASTGIDIEHLITFFLIGFIVALAVRGRELVATGILALIFAAMAVVGSAYLAIRSGSDAPLWRLAWYFADSFVLLMAGAIVRIHRLSTKSRPVA
jgi:hypothetical protein